MVRSVGFPEGSARDIGTLDDLRASQYARLDQQEHVYLGPSFSTEDGRRACESHPEKPRYEQVPDAPQAAARLLAEGHPVQYKLPGIETIEFQIIDDGSTDDTQRVMDEIVPHCPVPVRRFKLEGVGAAALLVLQGVLGDEIKNLEAQAKGHEAELSELELQIPNLFDESVPVGVDEEIFVQRYPRLGWDTFIDARRLDIAEIGENHTGIVEGQEAERLAELIEARAAG